ncbi:Pre-mRNA-splicing factor cwf16 [Ascochyta clinopodiicola]|nr:Pre-mRNA-splicing factor cwf16 [Ascochyta clinopodiicola]
MESTMVIKAAVSHLESSNFPMADRKCISKYIPADFDPSKLSRLSTKPPRTTVNFVCPFRSMRCLSCGSFTTKGTKFHNAPKEISTETYLGCEIIRLYLKCPRCRAPIVIETDPKSTDYRIVSGAKRGYEPWRNGAEAEESTEARLDRLEREERKSDVSAFEHLESRVEDGKREMEVEDALGEIQAANARREAVQTPGLLLTVDGVKKSLDVEDAKIAQAAFRKAKRRVVAVDDAGDDAESWIVLPRKRRKGRSGLQGLKRDNAE